MTMKEYEKEKPVEKLAWSIEEAAGSTGLSKGFYRKIIKAGELKVAKAGRRVLILDVDLREWLARNVRNQGE
jgi:excisionase family DNA binding protein